MGRPLTNAEKEMLALLIETPSCAWTTSRRGETYPILKAWESMGYFEEVKAPADFLVAFQITPAGRQALEADNAKEGR